MKAVIVDLNDKYAAAMAENGEIRRIPDAGYELGQRIELDEAVKQTKMRKLSAAGRRWAAAAAAFAILIAGGATAYAMPYGTVSVEVNPSIEYTINCFDYVLSVRAANEDGKTLLAQMDMSRLRHHKVETAVAATLERIEKEGYLEAEDAGVTVKADTRNDRHSEKLKKELDGMVHDDMGFPEKKEKTDRP